MRPRDRTDHEQIAAARRPTVVGPALLALVILTALPAAALAVAPNQNTLAEISLLLEQSRRASRTEARAERSVPAPADHAQRIKPSPARPMGASAGSLQAIAGGPPTGSLDSTEPAGVRPVFRALTRSGRLALPPPAR